MREALPDFQAIKDMEDMFLGYVKEGLKVIVICGGVRYGLGESLFHDLFKAAWLQDPPALPYLGQGDNQIPTIHVNDLVRFIIKVAEAPPEEGNYFLAFDRASNRTQKALIQSIADAVGSQKTVSVASSPLLPQ
jgi:adenylate kinase